MTQMLINMSQEDDLDNASPWSFLDLIGVPRPGGFQVKIDRSQIPKAEDLCPFLLPSVVATSVDERTVGTCIDQSWRLPIRPARKRN